MDEKRIVLVARVGDQQLLGSLLTTYFGKSQPPDTTYVRSVPDLSRMSSEQPAMLVTRAPIWNWQILRDGADQPLGSIDIDTFPKGAQLVFSVLRDEDLPIISRLIEAIESKMRELGFEPSILPEGSQPTPVGGPHSKSKRGPINYSDADKQAAVEEWEALDKRKFPTTLRQFLEKKFGNKGGVDAIPAVAPSTFYGWRMQILSSLSTPQDSAPTKVLRRTREKKSTGKRPPKS